MQFVLILTVASTVCAQAAPQLNNFGSGNHGVKGNFRQVQSQTNTENGNPLNGLIHSVFPLQSTFNRHRRPNENGRQSEPDNRRNAGQCWDPMSRTYRDWPNTQLPNQYTSQFYTGNFPRRNNNYNSPMNQYPNSGDYWGGYHQPSYGHGPHDHGHGPHDHGHGPHNQGHGPHNPGHGPHNQGHGPHDHGHGPHDHGHGPHDHGHGHGHDNRPPHNHGYGYESAHDHGYGPPHYHGNGRPQLPPRPPHREHHENVYKLEICEEPSTENILSKNMETTTIDSGSVIVNLPYSSSSEIPSISTSVKPEDSRNTETGTQSGIDSSVQTTTEFDWNNYFIGASADNTGGIGSIDIRAGGITAV